jgi:hypothetical protein
MEANRVGEDLAIMPYTASHLLLEQLDKEFPLWVAVREEKIETFTIRIMKTDDFLRLCNEALDKADAEESNATLYSKGKTS